MRYEELQKLLESLTIKEKIGQLIQLSGDFFGEHEMKTGPQAKLGIESWVSENVGSVLNVIGAKQVRLIQKKHLEKSKIPLLFMADILYGYKTIYPIPLAFASSWDPDLIEEAYKNIAKETSPAGVHVTFSPMVDVVRDARWGRSMESTGEDPLLNSRFAKAMVRGFQGDFIPGESLISCVKHFAAYGAPESGREYNTVDMSRGRLVQDYLPPYKAAIEAGAKMVMTSFNTIEGVPATANKWLLQDVLREKWGFEGLVISDYAAVQELVTHGYSENQKEATIAAFAAGLDIDMKSPCYANNLESLLVDGRISEDKLNSSVMKVLKMKNDLGLFEDPYIGIVDDTDSDSADFEEIKVNAQKVAEKSIVLLKNDKGVLPIKKGTKVALMGPYADNKDLIGAWAIHSNSSSIKTLKTVFESELDQQHFKWAEGCELLSDYKVLGEFGWETNFNSILKRSAEAELKKSIELAQWADVVVFAIGEHMLQSGEGGSRTDLTVPDIQKEWLDTVLEHTKKSVVLLFNGRPLVLNDIVKKVDSVLECWFPGTEGAQAIYNLVTGKVNFSGRLTMSFPSSVGQIPIYYSNFSTGRPSKGSSRSGRFVSRYLDASNEPLYQFGYGLSYSVVKYHHLSLSSNTMKAGDSIQVHLELENIGDREVDEIVQLYIHDISASVVRPVKELKDFKKILLSPKERKNVSFSITEQMLNFVDSSLEYIIEPGEFEVLVGPSSRTEDLKTLKFRYM